MREYRRSTRECKPGEWLSEQSRAFRDDAEKHAPGQLGLIKLIESRGWDWQAADTEIDEVLTRYELAG